MSVDSVKTMLQQAIQELNPHNLQTVLQKITVQMQGQTLQLKLEECLYDEDISSRNAVLASIDYEQNDCKAYHSTHSYAYTSNQQKKTWLSQHPKIHYVIPTAINQPIPDQKATRALKQLQQQLN